MEGESGAAEGIRTPDPIITNDVLYRLSYRGLSERGAGGGGAWRSGPEGDPVGRPT